jgi:hypothetical protein
MAILASTGENTTSGRLDLLGHTEAIEDPPMEDQETRENIKLEGSGKPLSSLRSWCNS